METERKRINFFCSLAEMDKLHNTLELEDDGAYIESAFTVDVIDFPFLLFYNSDCNACHLQINTRFDTYKHEEESGKKEAEIIAPKGGGLQGQASDDAKQVAAPFMVFCMKLAKFAQIHGLQEKYGNMDPEKEGILLEAVDSGLEYRVVSGAERPDMMCMTLSGNAKVTRPYEEDLMKRLLLDVMPLEMKEKMAETGNAEMMEYMFNYFMGTADRPHSELMSASRKMQKVLGALSGEGTDVTEEEPEEDTRNPEKAFYWLKKMAESGNADAMHQLVLFYAEGFGTERNFRKASEWMKKLLDEGLAGEDDAQFFREMIDLKEKAETGEPEAQNDYALRLIALATNPQIDLNTDKDFEEALQWAKKSAAQNYPDGLCTLGLIYQNGLGTEKDDNRAFRLFERAAEKGHAESQNKLGEMYFGGQGTGKDPVKAFEWIMKAAQQGVPKGMENAGVLYLYGIGVEKDIQQAKYWLKKAADLGDEKAEQLLSQIGPDNEAEEGSGEQETVETVRKAAEQGSVQAMKMLANYYIKRPGGREDLYEAYKWAQKAAEQGDEESKKLCRQLEASFNGETADFEDVRQGAENGNASSQKILADYYATGYKTERDLVKALYWMKKAAASGDPRYAEHAQGFVDSFSDIEEVVARANNSDPHAQAQLAEKYVGIFQNYPDYDQEKGKRDAFEMAGKSASGGDPLGMFVLGMCYENGYGTETDFDKAFKLYKQSAELGNPRGELSLSQVYLLGRGTESDPDAAVVWLEKAEQHGNTGVEQVRTMYPQIMFGMGLDKLGDGANSGGPNPELGVRLVRKAAELGHGEAQVTLGMLYLNGNNVEQDFEAGLEWLRKAVESGNRQAISALDRYDRPEAYNAAANKEFAKKDQADKEKVFRLMKHAAEGGLAASQSTLGFLYMNGYGVLPDYQKGMEWFRKAADQGDENAVRSIQKYESADGLFLAAAGHNAYAQKTGTVCPDGYELLTRAIAAGSAEAINMQGVLYGGAVKLTEAFGRTVEKDYEKARACFEKALEIKPDLEMAKNNLKKLEDVEDAERVGREPDATLKWIVMQKRPSRNTAGQV